MVSLVSLSEVTEEGVRFRSPYDGDETLLSPETFSESSRDLHSELCCLSFRALSHSALKKTAIKKKSPAGESQADFSTVTVTALSLKEMGLWLAVEL